MLSRNGRKPVTGRGPTRSDDGRAQRRKRGKKGMMKVLEHYDRFNWRRYGNPWVAVVNPKTAKPDFSKQVGGYTGGYKTGEEGDLYVIDPEEGTVYMYGQKDYRGGNTERRYAKFSDGEFHPVETRDLILALNEEETK